MYELPPDDKVRFGGINLFKRIFDKFIVIRRPSPFSPKKAINFHRHIFPDDSGAAFFFQTGNTHLRRIISEYPKRTPFTCSANKIVVFSHNQTHIKTICVMKKAPGYKNREYGRPRLAILETCRILFAGIASFYGNPIDRQLQIILIHLAYFTYSSPMVFCR